MAKLWQKNYTLDDLMQHFTVRTDYILDQELVISDALASCAHARGLERIGILKKEELEKLEAGLKEIVSLRLDNNFEITEADEDCHTAIEGYLTKRFGDVGKKIHTGRSRNDQVQTALRVYMREVSIRLAKETITFASELIDFAKKYEGVPMPGRTHMQIAMPSSVGLWAASFAEELMDEAKLLLNVNELLDQSPLGSAASYGAPIPLDREFTASQMGFSKVQNNVLYSNNSRGKFEAILLDQCNYIALTISKLSQDLILFTLPEFGYFSLPVELTTGSSIMPQKKNPDGLELARSRSALIDSCAVRVKNSIRSLPSGYNRDFQDTKEPLLEGVKETWSLVSIMARMVSGLKVHEENLVKACVPELYATDKVFDKVMKGGTFRDSYKNVGLNLEEVERDDPYEALKKRTSTGTSGALGLENDRSECDKIAKICEEKLEHYSSAYYSLLGLEALQAVNW
ncbi:MAG: argininosuccinate lyase [Sphaerochaetaceae bacterium]|nr:argininosuccinate lyase [Sphaerochaetaceae bacterium]